MLTPMDPWNRHRTRNEIFHWIHYNEHNEMATIPKKAF